MSAAHLSGEDLLDALVAGEVGVAEPDGEGGWRVNAWVKEELLAVFRGSDNVVHPPVGGAAAGAQAGFVDKRALPARTFAPADRVRLVPGGSAVRRGAFVAPGVVLMPPCYVNVGAWIGPGAMIDSHALVGSCAQVGARVHVSAAAQLGGVLEPVGALPVIIEDDVLVGGQCGVYEGVRVRAGAVLAAGVILTASTPVFDLVRGGERVGADGAPLEIPPRAVVVPGTRPARGARARESGLALACALIVKYRDDSTDRATALEEALRS